MRMTLSDIEERRIFMKRPARVSQITQDEIDRQVSEFVARGGCIKQLEPWESALADLPVISSTKQSIAGTKANQSVRASSSVGIKEAAKILGMCHKTIRRMIDAGNGPPHTRGDRATSPIKFDLYTLREWGKANGYSR